MSDSAATIKWLGASAFVLTASTGERVYIDPWLDNRLCPVRERSPQQVDLIVLTHGHADHVGQAIELWKRHRAPLVASQDLRRHLHRFGLEPDERLGPDKGGTITVAGISISLTDARHSSAGPEGGYASDPCGCVIRLADDVTLYFAGDTCVFGDMQLIGRIYAPDVAVLPIGGHYTMHPNQAALALELLGTAVCIPCHYRYGGPGEVSAQRALLPGQPDELRALAPAGTRIVAPAPGESLRLQDII